MNNAAKTRPAETLVSLAPAPSGAGVDILALTEDDLFLLTVRKVVKLPNRVWHATSDTQAADILMATPCAAVLADVALMQSQLPSTVKRLRQQFPDLAFVVAGEPENESEVAPLIQAGEAQSFIAKQNATRQLASALQLGVDRHFELNAETRPVSGGRGRSPVLFGIIAGVVAAIALVAAAVWVMTKGSKDPAPAQQVSRIDPAAGSATPTTSPAVEQALQNAREAFEAGRYSVPGDNNDALDYYRAALTLEPVNAEAKDGMSRITEIMLARTELALVEGNMRAASDNLKSAKAIEPSNPRVAFLETQISRETARTANAQQEAQQIEDLNKKLEELSKAPATPPPAQAKAPPQPTQQQRNAAEADRLLALGYERLSQGKLLQPADDSAQYYFQKVKQLQPDDAGLEPALTALRTRLIADAETALAANNTAQARTLLDAARNAGASGARMDQLSTQVTRATLQAQLLATPQPLQEKMLKKRVEPNYPSRARREGVEGYVELRITVSKQGDVKDVQVTGAQPQGYFEEEAERAVKRWKIEPKKVDGETYEQLLSLRLRFRLE